MNVRPLLLVSACLGCFTHSLWAVDCTGTAVTSFGEWIIADLDGTGAKRWAVTVPLPQGQEGSMYLGVLLDQNGQPTGPCDCPDAHRDCIPEPYAHVHYVHAYPLTIMINGTPFNITETMALAFWDDEYPSSDGYNRNGAGMDVSQNCFGHAMDLGTWVESQPSGTGPWAQKCWQGTGPYDDAAKLALNQTLIHAIKIEEWQTCSAPPHGTVKKIKKTSEKYRNSPVYERSMSCNPPFTLKQQFGGGYSWPDGQQIGPFLMGTWGPFKPKP